MQLKTHLSLVNGRQGDTNLSAGVSREDGRHTDRTDTQNCPSGWEDRCRCDGRHVWRWSDTGCNDVWCLNKRTKYECISGFVGDRTKMLFQDVACKSSMLCVWMLSRFLSLFSPSDSLFSWRRREKQLQQQQQQTAYSKRQTATDRQNRQRVHTVYVCCV